MDIMIYPGPAISLHLHAASTYDQWSSNSESIALIYYSSQAQHKSQSVIDHLSAFI